MKTSQIIQQQASHDPASASSSAAMLAAPTSGEPADRTPSTGSCHLGSFGSFLGQAQRSLLAARLGGRATVIDHRTR